MKPGLVLSDEQCTRRFGPRSRNRCVHSIYSQNQTGGVNVVFVLPFKGTVRVISNDSLCKDGSVRFTTVLIKSLSDQVWIRYHCLIVNNLQIGICHLCMLEITLTAPLIIFYCCFHCYFSFDVRVGFIRFLCDRGNRPN